MMKKKLALLLAAVMAITALPMTLFAATSDNRLTKSAMSVPDYTLMYESGLATNPVSGNVEGNAGTIEYWVDGSNLIIDIKDRITNGMTGSGMFKVNLENAEWYFKSTSSADVQLTDLNATVLEMLDGRYDFVSETGLVSSSSGDALSGTGYPDGVTSTYNQTLGAYNSRAYIRKGVYADTKFTEIPYLMEVSMAESSNATVTLLGDAEPGSRIIIPLVVRTKGTQVDVRVSVLDSSTSIAKGTFLLATSKSGRTNTRVSSTITSRTDFDLSNLIIGEQRIGSIRPNSAFELVAPSGYYFDMTNVKLYTEGGLRWSIDPVAGTTKTGLGTKNTDYTIDYRNRNGRIDQSILKVDLLTILPSTNVTGNVIVGGLLLISDDPDRDPVSGKELSLTIRDANTTNESFTTETVLVAKVSDYVVTMKRRSDEIPELISGRLDTAVKMSTSGYEYLDTITDENHKAATVRIEETIPNAWWAERTTQLTLPQGVKVLKAEFSEFKNLSSTSVTSLANREFFNTGSRQNSVITVRDNEIVISRLQVDSTTAKARFDLDLWLNVDVEFEGDIDLTLSGSAVTNYEDTTSVTIARAVRPIEVNTKVTDIKIGYQYVSVADFEIVENTAGALPQGETVYVSVTDEISVDMNIAKGFVAQVTEGNLKISNVITSSALGNTGYQVEGQLRFDIDRESTEASTIKFTNVQVKVDNTVPQSNLSLNNERGINLVVWGSAVAKNYEGLLSAATTNAGLGTGERLSTREFFATPGIRAKYINVTTLAPGGTSGFTNTVRVSIGNPVILIGEEQFTIPVAAYISQESNSTMVPIRFVSLALGLDESAVKWDAQNNTVTIDAGTRIVQFQKGNTNYLVNGVSVPMVSPDGLPVAMEIREERSFVPFRALGEAFGIAVSWDALSTTAIYNAPGVQ